MRQTIVIGLLALLWALPALGAGKNRIQRILNTVEVAVGVPITVTLTNPSNREGYLIVLTENETAAASLVVTVLNASSSGDVLVCTLTAITTNSVWVAYLGATLTPADGLDQANCPFPMARDVKYTFTVTGAGADFDVTADVFWITD